MARRTLGLSAATLAALASACMAGPSAPADPPARPSDKAAGTPAATEAEGWEASELLDVAVSHAVQQADKTAAELPEAGATPTTPATRPAGETGGAGEAGGELELFLPGEVPRESWEGVARRLAASLVDPLARRTEEALFLPTAVVWRFGSPSATDPGALRGRYDGQVVLSVRAGVYPEAGVAARVASDVAARAEADPSAHLTPTAVRRMTPRPSQTAAAELAMSRWLALSLKAEAGASVATVVLWDAAATDRPDMERLSFLLVKAGRLPDGRFRLQAVRFGTAAEAAAEGF